MCERVIEYELQNVVKLRTIFVSLRPDNHAERRMTTRSVADLFHQILKVRAAFRAALGKSLKAHDIDLSFEMLQILHKLWQKQGVSQQALAISTVRDKASLTSLLNNMEQRGLVERRAIAEDGRSKLIFLSRRGEELAGEVKPLIDEVYRFIEVNMNAETTTATVTCLEEVYETLARY